MSEVSPTKSPRANETDPKHLQTLPVPAAAPPEVINTGRPPARPWIFQDMPDDYIMKNSMDPGPAVRRP